MSADRTIECTEIAQWLDAYVDGEAGSCPGLSEQQFVDHLVVCRDCLEQVLLVRRLKALMATRVAPQEAPWHFRQTVVSHVMQTALSDDTLWQSESVWIEHR